MVKKGIILAGGKATRLYPLTQFGVSKQLLPVYNKPVIMYPLATLQKMGYMEVVVICASVHQQNMFEMLLGDGSKFNMKLNYVVQTAPNGLPEAYLYAEPWVKDADSIALILGDNIFIGDDNLNRSANACFTYKVRNPQDYGVAMMKDDKLVSIVEKPVEFIGDDAVVGLYVTSPEAIAIAKTLKPSKRGELEIVDLLNTLHKNDNLDVVRLTDTMWFDVGSFDSLLDCANMVRTIETRSTKTLGPIFYEQ
jgi:glucose-1-phosphate thymidylyltransferase